MLLGLNRDALEMTALLASRSERDVMHQLAKRIELSQEDEIKMMQEWLRSHGQKVTDVDAHHAQGAVLMPGMLTAEEMGRLEQAQAIEFDRQFLELMSKHHRGAIVMVEELLSQRGAAQESVIFAFTSDITADQAMEIDRMDAMLAGSHPIRKSISKPAFAMPARRRSICNGLRRFKSRTASSIPTHRLAGPCPLNEIARRRSQKKKSPTRATTKTSLPSQPKKRARREEDAAAAPRPGILNFANSDLAFAGDVLFEGNFHGFNTYNVEDPLKPQLLGSVVCPGGQGDLSVIGNLLIMSVEQTRGRLDCGLQGVAEPVSDARFRGVRIFDITDLRMPIQVAAVQTCRGSHTHTVVTDPDDEGNVYVFGSGTSSVRSGEELAECLDAGPGEDAGTALFSIDVIQIPLAKPEEARIVSRPRIFADPETGAIAVCGRAATMGQGRRRRTRPTSATTSPCFRKSVSRRERAPETVSFSISPIP